MASCWVQRLPEQPAEGSLSPVLGPQTPSLALPVGVSQSRKRTQRGVEPPSFPPPHARTPPGDLEGGHSPLRPCGVPRLGGTGLRSDTVGGPSSGCGARRARCRQSSRVFRIVLQTHDGGRAGPRPASAQDEGHATRQTAIHCTAGGGRPGRVSVPPSPNPKAVAWGGHQVPKAGPLETGLVSLCETSGSSLALPTTGGHGQAPRKQALTSRHVGRHPDLGLPGSSAEKQICLLLVVLQRPGQGWAGASQAPQAPPQEGGFLTWPGSSPLPGLSKPGDALSSLGASPSPLNSQVQSSTPRRGVAAWPRERGGQASPGGGDKSMNRPP